MQLMLMPGFMTDHHLWDDLLPLLTLDAIPVFGDLLSGATISEMAQRSLKIAPATFSLIGFSMGGYVAREMARIAPERVKSLILIGTSARGDTEKQERMKMLAIQHLKTSTFNGLSKSSIKTSIHPKHHHDEVLIERIQSMSARVGKEAFILQSSTPRPDDLTRLSQISCPTLIIGAQNDELRKPEESMELHEHIPNSKIEIIQDCGHMLPIEQAEILAKIIQDWLDQQH